MLEKADDEAYCRGGFLENEYYMSIHMNYNLTSDVCMFQHGISPADRTPSKNSSVQTDLR